MNSGINGYSWPQGFQQDALYQDLEGPIYWSKENQYYNA
jgi:hypothetical protein